MGLDIVELVMAVEDEFGVRFVDSEYQEMTTVGKMHEAILKQLAERPQTVSGCPSMKAFLRLRSHLVDAGLIRRSGFRPSIHLDTAIPRRYRRRLWPRLESATRLRLPRLHRPLWLTIALMCGVGSITVAIMGAALPGDSMVIFCTPFLIGILALAALLVSEPFATHLPDGCVTVGHLVKEAVRVNHSQLMAVREEVNPDDVWNRLHAIVVEQLCVRPDEVTRETRWIEDLKTG